MENKTKFILVLVALSTIITECQCQGNEDSSETNALQNANNNKLGQENNNNNNNNNAQPPEPQQSNNQNDVERASQFNNQNDVEVASSVPAIPTIIPTVGVITRNAAGQTNVQMHTPSSYSNAASFGTGSVSNTGLEMSRAEQDNNANQNQQDGNGNQHQQDGNGNQNQQDGNGNQNQQDGNGNQNQQDGNENQNQQDGNGNQNQQDGNGNQNQQDGNENQNQQDGNGNQNQQDGNGNQNQQDGNGNQNQQDGNGNQNQQDGNGNQNQQDGNGNQNQQDGNENQNQQDQNQQDGNNNIQTEFSNQNSNNEEDTTDQRQQNVPFESSPAELTQENIEILNEKSNADENSISKVSVSNANDGSSSSESKESLNSKESVNKNALKNFSFRGGSSGEKSSNAHPTFSYKHTFFDLSDLKLDQPSLDGPDKSHEFFNSKTLDAAKKQVLDNIDSDEKVIGSKISIGSIEGPSSHEIFRNDGNGVYLGSNVKLLFGARAAGSDSGEQYIDVSKERNDNLEAEVESKEMGDNSEEEFENNGINEVENSESKTDNDDDSSTAEVESIPCTRMDVLFVVDSSDDVSESEFLSVKHTLLKLSSFLQKGISNRAGIVWYGSRISDTVPLTSNASVLANEINFSPKVGGPNKPYLGILAGRADLPSVTSDGNTKVIVFLASGLQQYTLPTSQQASFAKADGIKIVAIGYGDGAVVNDLQEIASSNRLVLRYDQAADMIEDVDNLLSVICRAPTVIADTDNSESSSSESDNIYKDNSEGSNENADERPLLGSSVVDKSDESFDDILLSSDDSGVPKQSDESSSSDEAGVKKVNDEKDNTNQNPEDMCKNSKMVQGVGYKRYGTDCDKFIQCYFDQFGQTRASIKTCPLGEYWDHEEIACVNSGTANCPFDLCKSQTSLARPIEGNCRAHWTCLQGQSSMMCCPDQMAFHPVRGCIADPTCTTPCHQEQEPAEGTCDKRPMYGKPYLYKQWIESGHWVEMLCAPGTLFDEEDCGCTMRTTYVTTLGVRAVAGDTCRPELYLPFCEGVKDWSGRNTLVQNENEMVRVVNGKAYFNGRASLFIPRFSGATYGETIYIKIRYKPDFSNVSADTSSYLDNGQSPEHVIRKRSTIHRYKRDSQVENDGQNGDMAQQDVAVEQNTPEQLNVVEDSPSPTEPIVENTFAINNDNSNVFETINNPADTEIAPVGEQTSVFDPSESPLEQSHDPTAVLSDAKDSPLKQPTDVISVMSDSKDLLEQPPDTIIQTPENDESNSFLNGQDTVVNNERFVAESQQSSIEGDNFLNRDNSKESTESSSGEKHRSLFETSHFDDHETTNYDTVGDRDEQPQQKGFTERVKSYFTGWFSQTGSDGETESSKESNALEMHNDNPTIDVEGKVGKVLSADHVIIDYSSEDDGLEGDVNNVKRRRKVGDTKNDLSDISSAQSFDRDEKYDFARPQGQSFASNSGQQLPQIESTFPSYTDNAYQERIYGGRYFAGSRTEADQEKYNFLNLLHKERMQFLSDMQEAKAAELFSSTNVPATSATTFSNMALLSNAACNTESHYSCLDDPSVSIGTGKDSTIVSVYATESKMTTIKLHKSSEADDGWRTVLLTIDDGVFRVHDNDLTDFEPVSGPIKTTFSGIHIGQGTGMNNFRGYIDEVYVYLCKPDDADDFRSISAPKPNTDTDDVDCDYINKNVAKQYSDDSGSSEKT